MLRYLAPALPLVGAMSVACTDPVERTISIVRVAPAADPDCGSPGDARTMVVRALGGFTAEESSAQSIELGSSGVFSIDRFPVETRMLEVEVRGFGGALRTIGRSLEFDITELDEGAEIPIFMAPKEGVCPTGPAVLGRQRPLLARAGDAVLMAGGVDEMGAPVLPLERYDLSAGAFVQLSDALYADTSPLGLQGASMTELPSGDVVIVGGAATAYQVYETEAGQVNSPSFYREARAHHAAVALADNRIFLAGGCAQLMSDGCVNGSELLTSSILDPASGELEAGPTLQRIRIGGSAWVEGEASILLVGGVDEDSNPVPQAERVFFDGSPSVLIDQVSGVATQSPAGTVWVGLAGEGQTASAELSSLARGMDSARQQTAAFADSYASFVTLEDGNLLGLGLGGAQRIRSLDGAATDLQLAPLQGRSGQSAIRLADGSVLIVGGGVGTTSRDAFIFRPSLVGPLSASASVSFSSDDLSEGLSARDPARVSNESEFGAHLKLSLANSSEEWLIVAGPRFSSLIFEAAFATEAGEAVIYFSWLSPDDHWKLLLSGGTKPSLIKVVDGQETVIAGCQGEALPSLGLADNQNRTHEARLSVQSNEAELFLDGESMFRCTLDQRPNVGEAGLGLRGSFGQELRVDLISLGR